MSKKSQATSKLAPKSGPVGKGENGPGKSKPILSREEQDELRRQVKKGRRGSRSLTQGDLFAEIYDDRHGGQMASNKAAERPQVDAKALYGEFGSYLLSEEAPDIHLRPSDNLHDILNFFRCFFWNGTFPKVHEGTAAEMWVAFVSFCLDRPLNEHSLPGQRYGGYDSLRRDVQRVRAEVQVERDLQAEAAGRREKFKKVFFGFAKNRLLGDPKLSSEIKPLAVEYLERLCEGEVAVMPDTVDDAAVDRVHFNIALSCALRTVRKGFFPFQSEGWFLDKWDDVQQLLARQNSRFVA